MLDKKVLYACLSSVVIASLATACGRSNPTPVSPSTGTTQQDGSTAANPDSPTLKASAPAPVSPINDQELLDTSITLVVTNAVAQFAHVPFDYRFRVYAEDGTLVHSSPAVAGGDGRTTYVFDGSNLDFGKKYRWNAYAEYADAASAASANATFKAPSGGFLRGNEVFDPLWNGKTIGGGHLIEFVPGLGVKLLDRDSFVEYVLQEPCIDCSFSFLATNIGNGGEEWKTKVASMLRGDGINVTENAYRVTLDKRTTWVNQGSVVRYTMRSRGTDAGEPKSGPQSWSRSRTYFWHFEWRSGVSALTVLDGGRTGSVKAYLTTNYRAPYSPNPHVVRLGSVGGRGGNDTTPGTIIWNVWVSPKPRPQLPRDQ